MSKLESQRVTKGTFTPALRIAVISFFILTLELALIRFIPAEIKAISYFTNLLVFSAFFGLGVGCIFWKHELPAYLFSLGLLSIFAFVMLSRGITIYDTGGEVHYWLQQADQRFKPFLQMPLVLAAFIAFLVSALPFITLGWQLSREMQQPSRLTAYAYNLLGSFAGTIVFALLSYLGCPPWLLITVMAAAWAALFAASLRIRILHAFAGLLFLLFMIEPHASRWSPYYLVQYQVDPERITVWVNSSFHQEAINFDADHPTAAHMATKFSFPYEIYKTHHDGQPPQKLLIVGAGTGNDVIIALRNGASDITAVEIDPEIARIGRDLNPLHPYQDRHVNLVIDDGRHFLTNTKDQYDMVIFGTLDSQTLLSGQTNLRLDNYIYTTQCFEDVRRVLKPSGMLATYYSVFKGWFLGRIYSTVATAFPNALQYFGAKDNYLFNTIIMAGKDVPGFVVDARSETRFHDAVPSTDDWPYIYLERPTISNLYLQLFALIAAMVAFAGFLLLRVEKSTGLHLDFFFMGVGFSLMESASIVRLALAFGTTWVVSAVVFASVLLTVFLANLLVLSRPNMSILLAWAALLTSLGVNFFFPVRTLLEFSFPLRLLGAAVLIGTPVFFAGIAFSKLFNQIPNVGFPLGVNMIGAMLGGSIEYLSMLIGMKNIWLVLLSVYLAAFFCSRLTNRAVAS